MTAIDKDTGCERTLSINVKESNIAAVTLNDIIVSDLTSDNNNTITVDTTNLVLVIMNSLLTIRVDHIKIILTLSKLARNTYNIH